VRECLEETGIVAEITGFLGVYSNPKHIVAYSNGEIRQQYENTYIGRPVGGEPTVNDEADGVRWVQPADLSTGTTFTPACASRSAIISPERTLTSAECS
jgi:8-oxo-dGTP pyrophosphatase MutT (NUDIX family)